MSTTAKPILHQAPLNAVIIGCGDIAGGYDARHQGNTAQITTHVAAYNALDTVQVVACVDPDEDQRRAFAKRWDIENHYPSLEDCLSDLDALDIASICSSTANHADSLGALLDYQIKGVFCEKPLTADIKEAHKLVPAYAQANIPLAVNYLRRWNADIILLKQQLDNGIWKKPVSVHGLYSGGLLHNGSHMIDLLRYLFGNINPISATSTMPLNDDCAADLELIVGTDTPCTIRACDKTMFHTFELTLVCENGVIALEDWSRLLVTRELVTDPLVQNRSILGPRQEQETHWHSAMMGAVQNVTNSILLGEKLSSDGASALETQKLCDQLFSMTTTKG